MSSSMSLRIVTPRGGGRRGPTPATAAGYASGPGRTPGPPAQSQVSAVSATDLVEALREATGGALLRASQRLQPLADLLEALVAGGAGEPRVHLGVLI